MQYRFGCRIPMITVNTLIYPENPPKMMPTPFVNKHMPHKLQTPHHTYFTHTVNVRIRSPNSVFLHDFLQICSFILLLIHEQLHITALCTADRHREISAVHRCSHIYAIISRISNVYVQNIWKYELFEMTALTQNNVYLSFSGFLRFRKEFARDNNFSKMFKWWWLG